MSDRRKVKTGQSRSVYCPEIDAYVNLPATLADLDRWLAATWSEPDPEARSVLAAIGRRMREALTTA